MRGPALALKGDLAENPLSLGRASAAEPRVRLCEVFLSGNRALPFDGWHGDRRVVLNRTLPDEPERSHTIFALSSGRPPAAIAVVRICGPQAGRALETLIGRLPTPRQAALARVRDPASGEVDRRGAGAVVSRPAQRDRRGHGRAAAARRPRGHCRACSRRSASIEGCRPAEPANSPAALSRTAGSI